MVYAGQGERGRSLGDIFVLNLRDENREWKRGVTIKPPESRHQHTLVGDTKSRNPNVKYLFGGINTPNNTFYNDLWELDMSKIVYDSTNAEISGIKFTQIPTIGHRPAERKGHCSFFYMGRMFIYGGQCEDIDYDTMRYIHYIEMSLLYDRQDRKKSMASLNDLPAEIPTLNWRCIENKSAEISPRSLFSCSWYNENTLLVASSLS